MGRNSNNTLGLPEISLLKCYFKRRKIVGFHCEIPPNCSGKTRPDVIFWISPSNFALPLPHSQLQDKSYAASGHMEAALSFVYMLFHFSAIVCRNRMSQNSVNRPIRPCSDSREYESGGWILKMHGYSFIWKHTNYIPQCRIRIPRIWNLGLIFNMELSAFPICKVERLCPVLAMFVFKKKNRDSTCAVCIMRHVYAILR